MVKLDHNQMRVEVIKRYMREVFCMEWNEIEETYNELRLEEYPNEQEEQSFVEEHETFPEV